MAVLEAEPCLNRRPQNPVTEVGGAEPGRSGARPPAAAPGPLGAWFPRQGRAGLPDSGTFGWPGGPAEPDSLLCRGVTTLQWPVLELQKCPRSCAGVVSGIRKRVPSLRPCLPAADEIATSSLHPGPRGGGSLHTPVLASPQRGSARLLCPGVRVVQWPDRRRVAGRLSGKRRCPGPAGAGL